MVFIKKGVVVPLGTAGDFDDAYVYSNEVIKHAGRFFLYYTGRDDANYRIGLAISKDGITFVKKGVVIPLGASGDFDDAYAYCPAVIKHAGRFFLYYTGRDDANYRIGLAISKDGITFVKKGVVIPLGASGDFDDGYVYSNAVIKHAGRFFLYYAGSDGYKNRIGLAISKDGITFVKKGVVIPLGASGDFDDAAAFNPVVIKHAGRFFLYYESSHSVKTYIGFAISKDGITFVKKGVVVLRGASGDFDDAYVRRPVVIKHAGRFFLYYTGRDGGIYNIGLALSKDGL